MNWTTIFLSRPARPALCAAACVLAAGCVGAGLAETGAPFTAIGYVQPPPGANGVGPSVEIGAYRTRESCAAAVRNWMAAQPADADVSAECRDASGSLDLPSPDVRDYAPRVRRP